MTDVVLVMPYGRWRRWVRALRARAGRRRAAADGADPGDRYYLLYGLVLVGAMYGPILWSAFAQAGAPLAAAVGLPAVGLTVLGAGCLLGVFVARAGGPLWVSPVEAVFALGGAFPVRAVLWRRGAAVAVGLAASAGLAGSALAHGAGADAVQAGLLCALGAQLPLAVGVAAQCRWGRGFDVDAAAGAHRRTVATGTSLAAGDAAGMRDLFGPDRIVGRGRTFVGWLLVRAPLVARDLLGLSRRPAALGGSLLAGAAGAGLLVLGAQGPAATLATVGGGVLVYAATAVWARGLSDAAASSVPGGLLPWSAGRLVARHLVVPVALALGVVLVALGVLGAPDAALRVVALALLASAVRAWVAGATTAPVELFTPMSVPGGDMSMLTVAAWYVRGWLVMVLAAWSVQRFGDLVTVAVVVLAVLLVRAAVRRIERT